MKLTKLQLKQIIKEELEKALDESQWQDNMDAHDKCKHLEGADSKDPEAPYNKCLTKHGIPLEEYATAEEPPMDEPAVGPFDKLFEKGAPGDVFAEAIATQLWLDDEADFKAVVKAIKDGLERWKEYR
jgi:hypothetical protein